MTANFDKRLGECPIVAIASITFFTCIFNSYRFAWSALPRQRRYPPDHGVRASGAVVVPENAQEQKQPQQG
jgi:hypothetical protein